MSGKISLTVRKSKFQTNCDLVVLKTDTKVSRGSLLGPTELKEQNTFVLMLESENLSSGKQKLERKDVRNDLIWVH